MKKNKKLTVKCENGEENEKKFKSPKGLNFLTTLVVDVLTAEGGDTYKNIANKIVNLVVVKE